MSKTLNYLLSIPEEDIDIFLAKHSINKEVIKELLIELKKKENKLYVKNEKVFFKLVRDSFKFKRKTLKNNLRDYDLDKIEKILMESGLSLQVRAEALSLEMFVKIANGL